MLSLLARVYRIFLQVFSTPILLSDYFHHDTGREYGVGFWTKLTLAFKMIRNNMKIISGSTFFEHLAIAAAILKTPKELAGVVVECGSYKGVSAANLSLICAVTSRTLEIFDSFEGLPEPTTGDVAHTLLSTEEIHTYSKGAWCGTLEEVKQNIEQFGNVNVCKFHTGYFHNTLPGFNEKCILIWLDVDYRSSLETCLKNLWPLLQDNCYLYTHEAGHYEVASLFFSESWWSENFNTHPPGLVGAGSGLGLKILTGSYFNSSIGFAVKNPNRTQFKKVPQRGGMKLGFQAAIKLTSAADRGMKSETSDSIKDPCDGFRA